MPDVEAVLINTQPRAMSTNLEALPEPVASEDVEPSIGAETSRRRRPSRRSATRVSS